MNGLDLFSGYGGLTEALKRWSSPVAYCEKEKYPQAVLLSRIADGSLPNAPIWDDIRTLNIDESFPKIDIIYGGFPCQDISVAGVRKGLDGKRSGLFFEVCRLVKEVKPKFVFLENVPGIRTKGLHRVVSEITKLGYDCRWSCVSAREVGAEHNRKRWFLLAYSKHVRLYRGETLESFEETVRNDEERENKASEFEGSRPQRMLATNKILQPQEIKPAKSEVGRTIDGVKFRSHRIKALGNGVVPKQAEEAFKKLMGF